MYRKDKYCGKHKGLCCFFKMKTLDNDGHSMTFKIMFLFSVYTPMIACTSQH